MSEPKRLTGEQIVELVTTAIGLVFVVVAVVLFYSLSC